MKNFNIFLFVVLSSFVLMRCNEQKETCAFKPDTKDINITISFESLEDSVASIKSKDALVKWLTKYPVVRDYVLRRGEYPNDSVFINEIFHRFNNPYFDTLFQETKKTFGDGSGLRKTFTEAFTNLKYYYPDFQPPKIQTIISGLDTDLLVSDSLIVVSLDFFLGPGAKYRPKIYDYLLRQYKPENIVPSCMLIYGISDQFNATNLHDKTVLADMIAYGKSYYFAKRMLPCVPDSIFIWYTPEEIAGARKNQDLIWARLIEDQVLYSTNHVVKQKYLGERPKTLEVGEKCPGRIGQWIGWQIVNTYADHHSQNTLPEVMQMSQADKLFKESRYKPQ